MEITVKRRTWFLGCLMPIDINFNRKTIGSVGGFHTRTMEIPEESGTLTYNQPLDRTDRIEVKAGDVVLVKETALSKILNIFVLITMLSAISYNINTLVTGYPYESQVLGTVGTIMLIMFVTVFIISLFFNSYKFVIENNSSKE